MQIFQFFIFLFSLVFFHELGHVVSARILNLSIQRVGFQYKPYPHFFVAVKWPRTKFKRYIYLFSGSIIAILLFIVALYNHFFEITILYWSFIIQIAIETNPFYSDFTIAFVRNNRLNKEVKSYAENYKVQFKKYQYTVKWYIHFIIWTTIIVLLIRYKNQLV